ncbi:hypothetical protein KC343_g10324 [Hortaea werneckii]|nr:hypothetical protein KC352_g17826 [Hortaea werneckii]KAI7557785.1 hypothetical protein KC317_g11408 [Hortaea werneckii]KAI7606247.1 hypothetical protein KC346_g10629 [Hortaea werneckii]KAI7614885.1 hypothetical protein KC343_g10324 [Hortaea werneckii]KAI7650393.1 hypothetical protein KC319_g11067 [Hortaea werneckii]
MPGSAGDFKQSQQDFAFDDGRTKMQYRSSSTSWSSTSQSVFQDRLPTPILPLPPVHSPFSIQSPQHHLEWHNNLHDQAVHHANQLHNQSMLHAQQMMSSAMQDAFQTGQASVPDQRTPALPAPPAPSQQSVQTSIADAYQQQPLQLPAPSNHSQQDLEESRSQHQQLLATMEQRWASQEKEFSRQMQGLKSDLQEAKKSRAHDRKERDAKDQQIAALQAQIASQNQAQMELQQRHTQDMAQMAQAVASKSPSQTPTFDMGVLQQLIAEVRASRVNPADIENLVSGALTQRMSGLATKEDMQSASGAVGKALQNLDNNASEGRIQRAVEKAINKVVDQKMAQVQQTQKKIGVSQQQPGEMSPAIPKLSPGPPAYPSRPVGDIASVISTPSKKAKALSSPASNARSTIGKKLDPSNPKAVYGSDSVVSSGKVPTAYQSTESGHAMQLLQDDGASRISTSTKKAKAEPAQIEYPRSTVSRALESSEATKALLWHQDAASAVSKASSPSRRQARDNESVVSTSSRRSKRGDVVSLTAAAGGNENSKASKAHKSTSLTGQAALNRLANLSMPAIREAGESEVGSITSKAGKGSQLTAANLAQLPEKKADEPENNEAKSKVSYAPNQGYRDDARSTVSARAPTHDAKIRHNASDAASEARSVASSARSSGSKASKASRMSELRPPGQTGAELVLHRTTNEMLAGYHGGQEISALTPENDPRKAELDTFRTGAFPEEPEGSSQVSRRQRGQKAGRDVVQSKPESRLREVMSADDAASKVSKASKSSRR